MFDFTKLSADQRAELAVIISNNVAEKMLESLDARSASDRKIIKVNIWVNFFLNSFWNVCWKHLVKHLVMHSEKGKIKDSLINIIGLTGKPITTTDNFH